MINRNLNLFFDSSSNKIKPSNEVRDIQCMAGLNTQNFGENSISVASRHKPTQRLALEHACSNHKQC